jgi:ATP-binding cassette subfamily B protein
MNEKRNSLRLIKRFIKYYKKHKGLFALDVSCAVAISAINLTVPYLSRFMLTDLLQEQTFRLFFNYALILLGVYMIKVVFQYIVDCYGHILGVRLEYDMRQDLFLHLQKMPFSFYDRTRTGHLMSRLVNDLNDVSEMAHHLPEDLLISFLTITGTFIMMLRIDVKLALIVYAFVPILIFFLIHQRKRMSSSFKEVRKKMADINARTESSISGIRVSQSFANEEYEIEKFQTDNLRFRHSKDVAYRHMSVFFGGMFFMLDFLNLLVIAVGGYFIYTGTLNYPDLIAFTLYVATFQTPMRKIANLTQMFESGIAGFERFIDIMEEEPEISDLPDAKPLKNVKGEITFHDVSFSYQQGKEIIENLNLTIEAERTLALVGPSGGGKTTICNLIPRFYEASAGRITLDGVDIRDYTLKSLRQNIGLVSQDVFLFAGTIRENILYGSEDASEDEMIQAARNAEIHEYIMSLPEGYDTYVGERGIRLSGGQKQRISIARIFMKNPSILLLDEATSALDNETETKIQTALSRLAQGRTTLVIAHRLSTVKNADRIVVISDEGIMESGSHEELLGNAGPYARLYYAQDEGYIPDQLS